ncbi:hypothetical protein J2780_000764 [Chryseobacterium camelliae]|nr:hypothetical protein [Chryseobacterium camelliae]
MVNLAAQVILNNIKFTIDRKELTIDPIKYNFK